MSEKEIIELIKKDAWMMSVLNVARDLELPDWMIGAGFVRNKVWNFLHGYPEDSSRSNDIDLIYFDSNNLSEAVEDKYQEELRKKIKADWSVTNQARMHIEHNDQPYISSEDALSRWVETATCIAVKLEGNGELKLIAPYGIKDLVNLVVRPSPKNNRIQDFHSRLDKKNWLNKWPKLKVVLG